MATFITSDTHFFHKDIIKICSRPFASITDMHERMVANWNSVVGAGDLVIHLGDLYWRASLEEAHALLQRLHGHIYLVRGNHDPSIEKLRSIGVHVVNAKRSNPYYDFINRQRICCVHKPIHMPTWTPKKSKVNVRPLVRMCGHEHNNAPLFIRWVRDNGDKARPIMALNMSCELWDYTPVPAEAAVEKYQLLFPRGL